MDISSLVDLYQKERYDQARTVAKEIINELFGDIEKQENPFLSEGRFIRDMAGLDDAGISTFLSDVLKTIDYYCMLNEGSRQRIGCSVANTLDNILVIFPGHLMAQRAVKLIREGSSSLKRYEAIQYYGEGKIASYSEENSQGLISSNSTTLVDLVISNIDLCPKGGIVPYILAASYAFNNASPPSKQLDAVKATNLLKLNPPDSETYREMMEQAVQQEKAAFRKMIEGFVNFYEKNKQDSNKIKEHLEGIQVQYNANHSQIIAMAENLPNFITKLDPEFLRLIASCPTTPYLCDFGIFERTIGRSWQNIEAYIKETAIDPQNCNKANLIDALRKHEVPLNCLAGDFFERLKRIQLKLQSENLDELVELASLNIPKYDLIRRISKKGGSRTVYLGMRNDGYTVQVAVKVYDIEGWGPQGRDLFSRHAKDQVNVQEGNILSELDHQNIIKWYDGGTTESGICYTVEQFIDGKDLGGLGGIVLKSPRGGGPIGDIYIKMLNGINYMHRKGIIHRDIKPENVLLTADLKTVKITDLQFAIREDELTDRVNSFGATAYAAPDVRRKEVKGASFQYDIYSLGACLYFMLTGDDKTIGNINLFPRDRYQNALEKQVLAKVDPKYRDFLRKALTYHREDTYKSVREMKKAFKRIA